MPVWSQVHHSDHSRVEAFNDEGCCSQHNVDSSIFTFQELKLHFCNCMFFMMPHQSLRHCCTWNADIFSCRQSQGCDQRLGEILLAEWRSAREDLEEFIKLQWHSWLEGRYGSSYPVSKPRPVSPWTYRYPQTQHKQRQQHQRLRRKKLGKIKECNLGRPINSLVQYVKPLKWD